MKLKKVATITVLGILLSSVPAVQAQQEISVYVNGQKLQFETPPTIIDGNTLVPIRPIFEALGVSVTWDDVNKIASGFDMGVSVQIPIGKAYIVRCGVNVPIEVPGMIINDSTYIPLRAVAESLDCTVTWNQETQTITLNDAGKIDTLVWDTYTYVGEVDNGYAVGYGQLFDNTTNHVKFMGYFSYNILLEGVQYGDGYTYSGTFSDSEWDEGMLWLDDGTTYVGTFSNYKLNGYGTWYNADGGSISGMWVNGEPNGSMAFYDTDGTFLGYDVIETDNSANRAAYEAELADLTENKDAAIAELYEEYMEIVNTDPFSMPEAKEIMDMYEAEAEEAANSAAANAAAANGGNISSYGAAAAQRARREVLEQGKQAVIDMYNNKVDQAKQAYDAAVENIEQIYESQVLQLKKKYGIKD